MNLWCKGTAVVSIDVYGSLCDSKYTYSCSGCFPVFRENILQPVHGARATDILDQLYLLWHVQSTHLRPRQVWSTQCTHLFLFLCHCVILTIPKNLRY